MSPTAGNPHTGPIPDPLPVHIYKIIADAPPSPLPAEWPLSDLDRKDGFIHLSTAKQVRSMCTYLCVSMYCDDLDRLRNNTTNPPTRQQIPITAGLYFKDHTRLWIIKLPFQPFADKIRWEVPDSDGCPHLYGANFGAADVLDVRGFQRSEGQGWKGILGGESWLEH